MKALRSRAITLGFLTDFVGTWILGAAVIALDPTLGALSAEQQSAALATSPILFILGSLMTYAGGFVAGHLAPGEELANAFVVGALSTLLTFVSLLDSSQGTPFWLEALAMLITIPLAIAGGLTRASRRRRSPVSAGRWRS